LLDETPRGKPLQVRIARRTSVTGSVIESRPLDGLRVCPDDDLEDPALALRKPVAPVGAERFPGRQGLESRA
jgi:hypothetical protein